MNPIDSRRVVFDNLLYDGADRREASLEEEPRRTVTEIVEDWSVLVQDVADFLTVTDIDDSIIVSDIDDTLTVTGTPVAIGDYDDDIDR